MSDLLTSAFTDLDEWTRGVLFPLAVLLVVALATYTARCLRVILREFQDTRHQVAEIRQALVLAGLLDPPHG